MFIIRLSKILIGEEGLERETKWNYFYKVRKVYEKTYIFEKYHFVSFQKSSFL